MLGPRPTRRQCPSGQSVLVLMQGVGFPDRRDARLVSSLVGHFPPASPTSWYFSTVSRNGGLNSVRGILA